MFFRPVSHTLRFLIGAIFLWYSSLSLYADTIYETDFVANPAGAATSTNKGSFTTTMPSWGSGYSSAYLTGTSAGSCTISFSSPISLNGYENVTLTISYGSESSRPLNVSINGESTTTIHTMDKTERSVVLPVDYSLSVSSISSIGVSSSGGGSVYFFHISITGKTNPAFYKLQWSDGLEAGTKIEKSAADADFTYTATPKTESTGAITYTSNNTEIATVDANTGQVHLTGKFGSALITATQAASGSFPQTAITYTVHVAPTEIITQSEVGPIYYDNHNTADYCFADNSHCLDEFVDSIWVEAVGVSGYQWQQSADGVTWTDMQGFTSSYLFPPIPQTEITVATTTYYRCQITGAVTPLYSNPVQIVVEPAKGCYPNYMIDAKVTGAKTISVEGTIPNNTAECVLQGSNTYDGKTGYKMGNDNQHISMTLGDGYSFRQGDIVRVFVTQVGDYGDKTLHLYSDQGETKIGAIDGLQLGWNEWYLPASAEGINTICVYRHGAANDQTATNQNHYIYEMQVIRLEDCYDCASKEPTITIPQATGNPPQLCRNFPYAITGSLEGALSGYWTETSDASIFEDVRQDQTTVTFSETGTFTITWTVSDEHSTNRWGCRQTTQQTVEVIDAFPVELHTSCEHRMEERPSEDSPSKTVTFSVNGCSDIQGHYLPNDHLLVTAIGDDCNDFKQWSDGNKDNPRLVIVGERDFTITSEFEQKQFTIRVESNNAELGDVDILQP